ncbi:oxysterol-binding protein-related protein 3C [Tanacetum coccineum]
MARVVDSSLLLLQVYQTLRIKLMGCLVTKDWRLLIQKEELMMLKLKHNEADGNKRIVSHWKMMQKYIGADITSMVTLPVLFFLANDDAAENGRVDGIFPPAKKLADECEDPHMRMVCNHPPISAARAENEHFVYDIASKETKSSYIFNPVAGLVLVALIYQSCDLEGEPLPGTDLKEVWEVAEARANDKFQYTHFGHKVNSFDTAPTNLLASDSRLQSDRYALEHGDLSKAGLEKSILEEKQRAEKMTRETKGQKFTPRWFDMTEEVCVIPWGDLEIYWYNGKYSKHRYAIDDTNTNKLT